MIPLVLATKLYVPPPRPKIVPRPRLVERLNADCKLALISAPAGFGKTTLISEWLVNDRQAGTGRAAAWLSLEEGDNDLNRFLTYLVAAIQTVAGTVGEGLLAALGAPQPPQTEMLLTGLLNEIAALPEHFTLVLDDYHAVEAEAVQQTLAFLVEHLPPQMRLVIASREDPRLPLARMRARGQLVELRAADLRFSQAEAAEFLNQAMGLDLSPDDIAALEARTEGWIAGLQLAALALQGTSAAQGRPDAASFIQSFTGSRGPGVHRYILDYLVEEVLRQQPENVQTFLLRTSILDRFNAELSAYVIGDWGLGINESPIPNLQSPLSKPNPQSLTIPQLIDYLERANLFIVPLDDERRWYRYHHLFADLLRQRQQAAASSGDGIGAAELHRRASQWYEDNGLELEAFEHAAAAQDIARAARLIEGKGMPLLYRGAMAPVLRWLETLPEAVLDGMPSLWVTFASALMISGRPASIEPKLRAAEAALESTSEDEKNRDLSGQIAALRGLAIGALSQGEPDQAEAMIAHSRRALELLRPDNLPVRAMTSFTLGFAYQLQGDRPAAGQAFRDVIATAQESGNVMFVLAAAVSLGGLQEAENLLHQAAETYRRATQLAGAPPSMISGGPLLGLGRIFYEWNDLETAEEYGRQSMRVAPQIECDLIIDSALLLARVLLARGDSTGAAAVLAEANEAARQNHYLHRVPEIANAQVRVLLQQGSLAAAARLAQQYDLPEGKARAALAQGNPSAALAALEPLRQQMDANNPEAERLRALVLLAAALQASGEKDRAMPVLDEALALAEPGGNIRVFLDEGDAMFRLLSAAAAQRRMPDYVGKLLAAFESQERQDKGEAARLPTGQPMDTAPLQAEEPLLEPLSQRELEVLRLVAQGLSNAEISQRLFIALSTVKGHNRIIFEKLQVQNRTEAVARAREKGLL